MELNFSSYQSVFWELWNSSDIIELLYDGSPSHHLLEAQLRSSFRSENYLPNLPYISHFSKLTQTYFSHSPDSFLINRYTNEKGLNFHILLLVKSLLWLFVYSRVLHCKVLDPWIVMVRYRLCRNRHGACRAALHAVEHVTQMDGRLTNL